MCSQKRTTKAMAPSCQQQLQLINYLPRKQAHTPQLLHLNTQKLTIYLLNVSILTKTGGLGARRARFALKKEAMDT